MGEGGQHQEGQHGVIGAGPGREVEDLIAVGAAPPLQGVYAGDTWDGRTHVFITHMHLDHTGLIAFLGPDVPLYYPAAMEPIRKAAHISGYLPWRRPPGSMVEDGATVAAGPIQVRFVAVDHDVPGSTGSLAINLRITASGPWRKPRLTTPINAPSSPWSV